MPCMRLHLPRHQALHVVPGYQLLRLRPVRKGWRKIQTMSLVKNVYLWMALSYIWKPPEFSIKHFFKHFDVEFSKHVVPLTFSPTAPAEPTPPGGPCGPCGCKQESLREKKQDKSYATELLVWLVWLKKNLQLFRQDPEDLWGQEDQVDPVKHSFVSAIEHLSGLVLHFIVTFALGWEKSSLYRQNTHK